MIRPLFRTWGRWARFLGLALILSFNFPQALKAAEPGAASAAPKNWLGQAVEFSAVSASPLNLAEAQDYCRGRGGGLPLINGASYLPWEQIVNPQSAFIDGIGPITTGRDRPADWTTPWPAGLSGGGYWTGTENGSAPGYFYSVYDEGGLVNLVGEADRSAELRVVCVLTDGAAPSAALNVGFSEAVALKYGNAYPFSEGLAAVMLDNKWGYIDREGQVVLPLEYDYAYPFSKGLARVQLDGQSDYIDKTGQKVRVPPNEEEFSEGLAAVMLDNKWGYIDQEGQVVVPPEYDHAEPFSGGVAIVAVDGKFGLIDKTGRKVAPLRYNGAWGFSEGLAYVRLDGKFGFIDRTGQVVVPIAYDNVEKFSEGFAAAMLDGKWGFIDITGQVVVPPKYDEVKTFSEGLAAVRRDGQWGFIDKTGVEAVPLKYGGAGDFSEGLAAVKLDGKWGFMAVSPPAFFPVPASSAEPNCLRVNIESGKLRVRECAGAECAVIGELQRGDEVCPTQTKGDWAELPYENGPGHVFARYLMACPRQSGPLQTLDATFLREEFGDHSWVTFRLANGEEMRLQGTVEGMALKEGARVTLSYQAEQFWENHPEIREESMCVRMDVLQSVKVLP